MPKTYTFHLSSDVTETPVLECNFLETVVTVHGCFDGTYVEVLGSVDGKTFLSLDYILFDNFHPARTTVSHIGMAILQKVRYIKAVVRDERQRMRDAHDLKIIITVFEKGL